VLKTEYRGKAKLPSSGPYLAEITNHLDPTYMGALEVALTKGIPGSVSFQPATYTVQYLSPFYGVTSIRFEGNDSSNFQDVQKSYGMWMVPPDVGTRVLVIFLDGDPNQGYWIGCVPDAFQNQMVPGIAASKMSAMTQEQLDKYGTTNVPVAEFLKGTQKLNSPSIDKIPKPVHPFADRLLAQGLLLDTVRGVTSSSARREVPSGVFGISTPGPLDPNGKKGKIGYEGNRQGLVSRLGGTTFVMDDGDVNGQNELVRLRTRTGHQLLMHNSQDLIYIANAAGTAWIELTSQGKIDIYSADAISIHSESDINMRADRDFNIEAGRNLNMVARQGVQLESASELHIISDNDAYIQSSGQINVYANNDVDIGSESDININGSTSVKIGSANEVHLISDGIMYQQSLGNFNVNAGGSYFETAAEIHMNGPTAATATTPSAPDQTSVLARHTLPNRQFGTWGNGTKFKATDLVTILPRVPTHEPYDQHENINPTQYSSSNLDLQLSGGPLSQISGGLKASISGVYNRNPAVTGTPPTPTGNTEQDNIAAFLWMIRACEGTAELLGYQAQFPSTHFAIDNPDLPCYQFNDHPGTVQVANGLRSSAAGAYQFLISTWKSCKKILGLSNFNPANQDSACILLLAQNNSLDDIKAGRFTIAVEKNKRTWASLPGANYPGQGTRSVAFTQQVYKQAGGTLVA
jgi:muramidase (phage lysozyme)/uncharacterized protein (DUF2345 family)